jgi:hypothetical protein
MSVRPDFTVACSDKGDFIVRESLCHEYCSDGTLRDALSSHLEDLTNRAKALHGILATTLPEDVERLLLDGTRFRVDEVTLRAPASPHTIDALFDRVP